MPTIYQARCDRCTYTSDVFPAAYGAVFVDEPSEVGHEVEAFWEKLERAHEQSGVGKLVTPEELFLSADDWETLIEWLETLEDTQIARQAFTELKVAKGNRRRAGWLEWKKTRGS